MSTPELLACPFCGATPHRGLTKPTTDQLHGELLQHYRIWCPQQHASHRAINEALAIESWNARPRALAQPVQVSGEPVAWQVEWHEGISPVRQFYPDKATAERVKNNVLSYKVGVFEPIPITPLYAHPASAAQYAPQPSGEPRAYIVKDAPELGNYLTWSRVVAENSGYGYEALYTHPAVSCAAREALPEEITPEIACILEQCDPPEKQTPEAVGALMLGYAQTWADLRAALATILDSRGTPPTRSPLARHDLGSDAS
jgi:hypothetical protein